MVEDWMLMLVEVISTGADGTCCAMPDAATADDPPDVRTAAARPRAPRMPTSLLEVFEMKSSLMLLPRDAISIIASWRGTLAAAAASIEIGEGDDDRGTTKASAVASIPARRSAAAAGDGLDRAILVVFTLGDMRGCLLPLYYLVLLLE